MKEIKTQWGEKRVTDGYRATFETPQILKITKKNVFLYEDEQGIKSGVDVQLGVCSFASLFSTIGVSIVSLSRISLFLNKFFFLSPRPFFYGKNWYEWNNDFEKAWSTFCWFWSSLDTKEFFWKGVIISNSYFILLVGEATPLSSFLRLDEIIMFSIYKSSSTPITLIVTLHDLIWGYYLH